MRFDKVKFWSEDGVGVVAIDNGELNLLDLDVLTQLMAALTIANQDPNVGKVVVTATQAAYFTAGVDWGSLGSDYSSVREFVRAVKSLFALLITSTKPIFTVLNGSAVGLGVELALASDLAIAPPDIYLCYPEGMFGVPMAFQGHVLLSRLPRLEALRFMMGESATPEKWANYGIIHLLPRPNLMGDAKEVVKAINIPPSARQIMHRLDRLMLDEAEPIYLDSVASKLLGPERGEFIKAVRGLAVRCRSRFRP